MRKLTKEELKELTTKPPGNVTYVRAQLVNMAKGEAFLIEPKDWKWKSKTPTTLCRRLEKQTGMVFDCQRVLTGHGWVVKRVK